MDFRKLHYILTIAEEGSINKAAQKLFIAQSSLSQFLKNMNFHLATPCFIIPEMVCSQLTQVYSFGQARQIINIYRIYRTI